MIYPYLTRAVVIINFDQAYLHTVIKYMYMYFYINKVLSPHVPEKYEKQTKFYTHTNNKTRFNPFDRSTISSFV